MPAILALVCAVAGALLCVSALAADRTGDFRLDGNVIPLAQEIDLVVDPARPDYSGQVRIWITVKDETASFRLHAENLEIREAILDVDGRSLPLRFQAEANGMTRLSAETPIAPGEHVLEIAFTNEFNTQAVALYRLESQGRAFAFTQLEADEARRAFPCWDEPGYKIPYRVAVTVPASDAAYGNTPVEREEPAGEGFRRVVFRETKPLPAYLLALAVGPLERVPLPGLGVPASIVFPPGGASLTAEAVRITPPILAALERYFGMPYPFEKLDLVAVPEFWPGAMENPGLVTFADGVLLLDPARATIDERARQARVIAHELAHMWFGDMVTMQWWDDLWLNESFAQWMAYKVCEDLFPEFEIELRGASRIQETMATDATLNTREIRQPVTTIESLLSLADAMTYTKGRSVLRMFEAWMGADAFREAVNAYLADRKWGNATASDLWDALAARTEIDVGSAMASFVDQPGVPMVEARVLGGGLVELTQRRFLHHGATLPPGEEPVWRIPLVIRYADREAVYTQKLVLEEERRTFSLQTENALEWLHLNVGEGGYYRWMVPGPMLRRLIEQSADVLDPAERVGLCGLLPELLRAGEIPGDGYLRLLETLAADPDPEILRNVLALLREVDETFVTGDLEPGFAAYLHRVLQPSLLQVGLEPARDERPAITRFRPELLRLLAGAGADGDIGQYAEIRAADYLRDASSVPPSLVQTFLAVRAMRGDRAFFDECRRRFETASVPGDRHRFLTVLGEFRDPALTDQALAYALTGPLRPQEVWTIPAVKSMAGKDHRDRVLEWVTENYETILARIPPPYATMLPYFAGGCSAERLARAKAFFADPVRERPGTSTEMARVAESVNECLGLADREGDRVRMLLMREISSAGATSPSASAPR